MDIEEWCDPLSTGVHMILGKDQSYAYYGAVAGSVFPLKTGTLVGVTPICTRWRQSGGRGLADLLRTPPKPQRLMVPKATHIPVLTKEWAPELDEHFTFGREDLEDLRILTHGETVWIMTPSECLVWSMENPHLFPGVKIERLRITRKE